MMKAIRAALDPSDSQEHVRIVCFMTDGYVGNDMEIIGEVQKHPNARVFSFGIGSSVNRFLLDKMARRRPRRSGVRRPERRRLGRRAPLPRARPHSAADRHRDRLGRPRRRATSIPQRIPDLFGAKPVVLNGRYRRGRAAASCACAARWPAARSRAQIAVDLPGPQPRHDVLATLWARAQSRRPDGAGLGRHAARQSRARRQASTITQLGLDYRLMTQFTSFVAVEERVTTEGGEPRRIEVPVEMPEGVSYEGVFGDRRRANAMQPMSAPMGVVGGVASSRKMAAPPPFAREEVQVSARADVLRQKEQDGWERKLAPELAGLLNRTPADVDVVVWTADTSEAALKALAEAGLKIQSKVAGKSVTGRVSSAKLGKLAQLPGVRFIAKKA